MGAQLLFGGIATYVKDGHWKTLLVYSKLTAVA